MRRTYLYYGLKSPSFVVYYGTKELRSPSVSVWMVPGANDE